jgi:hypothetical protein
MSWHTPDFTMNNDIGRKIARQLGEPELPAHVVARLQHARNLAVERAASNRAVPVTSGPALVLGRSRLDTWLSTAVMALALASGLYLATNPASPHDYDWTYHVHAESSEELLQLMQDR